MRKCSRYSPHFKLIFLIGTMLIHSDVKCCLAFEIINKPTCTSLMFCGPVVGIRIDNIILHLTLQKDPIETLELLA